MAAILNLELPCMIVGRSSGRMLLRMAFATSLHNPPNPQHLNTPPERAYYCSTSPVVCSVVPIYRYLSARNAPERKLSSIVNGNNNNHLQFRRKKDDVSSLCSSTFKSLPFPCQQAPILSHTHTPHRKCAAHHSQAARVGLSARDSHGLVAAA